MSHQNSLSQIPELVSLLEIVPEQQEESKLVVAVKPPAAVYLKRSSKR